MKKKSIKIVIPSGLSDQEESFEIAKKLNQKLLAGNGRQKDKVRLGTEINIKHGKMIIEIERKVENVIEFIPCIVCGTEYQNTEFLPVFTNYGGKVKKHKTCSENCQNNLIDCCGYGRAAIKRNDLKPLINFNRR